MATESKPDPITSTQFAKKEDRRVEFGSGTPTAEQQARNQENDQKISVRALRTFHKESDMKGDMVSPGDEFECPRSRAAELRANGLIEYVDASHAKDIHGDETAKKIEDRVKLREEQEKAVDKHKTTPLRNPELKLAEVPADAASKK